MSAQVCPVCGGKGLVPHGFYNVGSSNLSDAHKTTSATPDPETCRSCRGKGYIIEFPGYSFTSVEDDCADYTNSLEKEDSAKVIDYSNIVNLILN